jgi:transcriptional regulator with XRE-family HTH domain
VARWELSLRLRERRLDLGLSTIDVAKKLGVTRNYISLVENDKTIPAKDKLQEFLDVLSIGPNEQQKMFELRDIGRQRGWWMDYADLIPDRQDLLRFYGMEYGATSIRAYEGQMINGLLQTEAYARELMMADPSINKLQINRLIRLRQSRQKRLRESDPLELSVVMSEAVLLQIIGTNETLIGQLKKLLDLSTYSNIEIRIIPFDSPAGGATGSLTFYLLEYKRDRVPRVAWLEAGFPLELSHNESTIEELAVRHRDAANAALDREASQALIRTSLQIVSQR